MIAEISRQLPDKVKPDAAASAAAAYALVSCLAVNRLDGMMVSPRSTG